MLQKNIKFELFNQCIFSYYSTTHMAQLCSDCAIKTTISLLIVTTALWKIQRKK